MSIVAHPLDDGSPLWTATAATSPTAGGVVELHLWRDGRSIFVSGGSPEFLLTTHQVDSPLVLIGEELVPGVIAALRETLRCLEAWVEESS